MEAVVNEVGKVFVGDKTIIRKILMGLLAGGHVLLEDIPGVGKTTLARAVSSVLSLSSNRIQMNPDVMPTDITGFSIYSKERKAMVYQPGAALCNLLMADELNRAPSRTQAALLEAMEEQQVTVDGHSHTLPQPFMVLATQNPTGSAGTQLLPESQMDRFMMRLSIGYPSAEDEAKMLLRKHGDTPPAPLRQMADADAVLAMRREVSTVYMVPEMYAYIIALVGATRKHPDIQQGISPRGSVTLMTLAQASAYMDGRDYVVPQDVLEVLVDATAHRLILSKTARHGSAAAAGVLRQIAKAIRPPQLKTAT